MHLGCICKGVLFLSGPPPKIFLQWPPPKNTNIEYRNRNLTFQSLELESDSWNLSYKSSGQNNPLTFTLRTGIISSCSLNLLWHLRYSVTNVSRCTCSECHCGPSTWKRGRRFSENQNPLSAPNESMRWAGRTGKSTTTTTTSCQKKLFLTDIFWDTQSRLQVLLASFNTSNTKIQVETNGDIKNLEGFVKFPDYPPKAKVITWPVVFSLDLSPIIAWLPC